MLVTAACETLLKSEKVELQIIWPEDGKDQLYRMAVETDDPHNETICEFLDENCKR